MAEENKFRANSRHADQMGQDERPEDAVKVDNSPTARARRMPPAAAKSHSRVWIKAGLRQDHRQRPGRE